MYASSFQSDYLNQPASGNYPIPPANIPTETFGDGTEKLSSDYYIAGSSLEKSLRVNFIRKVFGIVAIQLLITTVIANLFISHRFFYKLNYYFPILVYLAGIVAFAISMALGFSSTLSTKVPLNYTLLGIFTVAESYCVGFLAAQYDKEKVLSAVYLTAAVVGTLALYALRSKTEITYHRGLILMIGLGSLVITFFSWITGIHFFDSLLYAGACIISGLYFIYDVKLLMGSDRIKMSLDDYVKGAMHLYIDIVKIFINILQMFASKAEEEQKERQERQEREQRLRKRWF